MKLSKQQALKFLSAYLADVEIVEDDNADVNDTELHETVAAKVLSERKPAIEQELRGQIKSELAGEMGEMQRKQLAKTFGITDRSVLKDLNFEQMLGKAKELHAGSLKMDVNEWNSKHEELANQIQEMQTAHEAEISRIKAEGEEKINRRDVDNRWLEIMTGVKTVGGDKSIQAQMLHQTAVANGYNVKYNAEKKQNEFYKDNQLVIKDGKVVTDAEFASTWAEKAGILAKDNRHEDPLRGNPPTGNGATNPANNGKDIYAAAKAYAGAD